MAQKIDITLSAKVKNGPTISFSNFLNVDAYDKVEVTVSVGSDETIQLMPADTSAVQCIIIISNIYGKDLSYKVNGAGDEIVLDSPQCFIGEGAVSALDAADPPSKLVITNGLPEDAQVQILVARSAIA